MGNSTHPARLPAIGGRKAFGVDTLSKPRSAQLKIGRFILNRWLGTGLQGKVFQAFDPVLERTVAIKWLKPSGGSDTPHSGASSGEGRIAAKLEHPNIVPLYEAGEHGGYP